MMPAMSRHRLLSLWVLASLTPGCECLFPFDEPGPRRDGGDGFLVNEEPRPECFQERLDLAFILDAGIPGLAPEGVSTLSLSPGGCYRFRSTVEGGVLKKASVLHYTGDFRVEIDGGLIAAYNVDNELMRVDHLPDAMNVRFDEDEDGVIEETLAERYLDAALVSSVRSRFAVNGELTSRTELSSVASGQVHFTSDELTDGVLTRTADFDAPALQNQTASCYANAENTFSADQNPYDCPPEVLERVRQDLNLALTKYYECLNQRTGPVADRLVLLNQLLSGQYLTMPTRCFSSPRVFGAVSVASRHPVLFVNIDMMRCEGSAFTQATLGHEMLHLTRRVHNPVIERLYGLGKLSHEQMEAADSTFGCEGMCARPETTTRCACARCLGTKACDARCSDLASCVVRRPTPDGGNEAVMSEAVGALCQGGWYRTMAACASSCASSASCRSYSVSCDKRCQ